MTPTTRLDHESCYRAVKARDRRFDGVFYTAVRTTGIYCRPSCPARTPAYANVTFHPSAAAAQAAGYRACKRCLPDATPGSPDWDVAADVAGRAMRLVADGVVDREGVEGLAARVGYTPRHLGRILTAELGAGPLALARARRAQTARVLIETTDLSFTDIAFAAGFTSVRQFNETVREVYASSPTELRGRRARGAATGEVRMRLGVRTPFAGRALHAFLAAHVVAGVEEAGPGWYARSLELPHGPGTVRIELDDLTAHDGTALLPATFRLDRPARHQRGGGAGPPDARRRLRPGRRRRRVRRRPGRRAAGAVADPACGCPATPTATSSPYAPSSGSRSASPEPAPSRRGSCSSTAGRCPSRRAG